jgi:16S rRNA (cytosine967-C5)-methyltransferase
MTPAARLQAAIEILDQLNATNMPADRFIREWFRARRYAGSKDRAAIAGRVFEIMRHRSTYAWRMRGESSRALVIASVLAGDVDSHELDVLFSGKGYGPSALTDVERSNIGSLPAEKPPLHVVGEFPEFMEKELKQRFGDTLLDEMRAAQARAPVDLRVNTLKADRDDVLDALRAEGFAAKPGLYSPFAIRIASSEGLAVLRQSKLFEDGAFEFQDEGSQIAALLAHAKPGERVLDLAAGAGGKALALAAAMQNEGEIVATDIHPERLRQIEARAARAGVRIIRNEAAPPDDTFDLVFVDAPCSGTGTWRRQPELRWRISPDRITELVSLQDRLLKLAVTRVRPGGRIVYVTCSLLASENENQVEAFLARNAEFTLKPAADNWRATIDSPPPPGMAEYFRASPHATGTDGFFAAVMERIA